MPATSLHPEDVRAALRKQHGTLGRFAAARGLKGQQVVDWLRGRSSAPVAQAVADELGVDAVHLEQPESMKVDDSAGAEPAHRQNAEAR